MENEWLSGVAVRGDGRGRRLGFPTANLSLDEDSKRPDDGVYTAWVRLGKGIHRGVVHIGPRPTFVDAGPTVEVHILEFTDRELYGEEISFQVVERLRGIRKFSSPEELTIELQKDCNKAANSLT